MEIKTILGYRKDDSEKTVACFLSNGEKAIEIGEEMPELISEKEIIRVEEPEKKRICIPGYGWCSLTLCFYPNDHACIFAENEYGDTAFITNDDSGSGRNGFSLGRPLARCWIYDHNFFNALKEAGIVTLLQEQKRRCYNVWYCRVNIAELWKYISAEEWEEFIADGEGIPAMLSDEFYGEDED